MNLGWGMTWLGWQGTLLATDIHAGRLHKLQQAAEAQGLGNVQTLTADLFVLAVRFSPSLPLSSAASLSQFNTHKDTQNAALSRCICHAADTVSICTLLHQGPSQGYSKAWPCPCFRLLHSKHLA